MAALSNVGIGSVILNMVENVPTTISGATLWNMIDQEIYFAEQFTGNTIGTTSVANVYQPAIISLASASVMNMMELTGADVSSLKLGDFTVGKGATSNVSSAGAKMKEDGMEKLRNLGQSISFYKALG